MQLYTHPQSRGQTLMPLLQELQIQDQIEIIQVSWEDLQQPEYRAMNPLGKVPLLVDGPVFISETPAIFAYLADHFFEQGLAPALDDPQRGAYFKWLFFCHGPLTEWIDLSNFQISQAQLEQHKRGLGMGLPEDLMAFLKQGLQQANPYLLGERMSAADLYLAYWLAYAIALKAIPYLEEFRPYLQWMAQRPSLSQVIWFQQLDQH
ncbi:MULTISPECIES: glutathione S-transferase family protein [Acinetobacter]|uniref:Glutathione S-transferase family protein n=1 Tax=Acinetobacter indicus TaxID=756892 RepID=A0AAW8Z897_9GAMM|nr:MULTISPECIES: glutathione S-transferase family protein [Acinetobacter]ENW89808.1 hypothetical protein F905_01600 [Acinetobacter sp. CIP 53.82]MBA0154941.1 glutathione S-transferase family protein [Acinetobacter indicus]MDM1269734.1 glutathione S-transferase family protein [Acinetobacter indicus]MDM1272674.1 glutathione S-transferase family protein [Acinetobacter indicus]MDM1303718.1 glutathione S-transferase family protein [Acinetobacter indicus]